MVNFVKDESLEDYSKRFEEHFVFKRENGILEVRMHEDGGAPRWSYELHRALPQMFAAVGADRENEVFILTGTDDVWLKAFNPESFNISHEEFLKRCYEIWYLDGTKLQENMLWDLDIPTIAAINGPGFHTEFGLLADLTICSDDAAFHDSHYPYGMVPGDGQFLVLQELIGIKRANHMILTQTKLDAHEALDLGIVNEVMPRSEVLPRAWELAREIMKQKREVRRLTSQVLRRRWKRVFTDDFNMHFGFELYAAALHGSIHDSDAMNKDYFD